ncbi:DNA binding domain-containing protein, excisionase family [Ferrithrix thermotolerans DSM 19514]|jgi:excisionase family DNA binding protein|uniref:DNA binding domain-containing protein, excisionase family n=1 Tax=Ferrithrix thermotolerans DSM 19514 TaxID=1121881 RepID=A0A1M4US60_9ACTN|nr:B12-binding domain-containing protein [Ferrithrix thermotolerans]SHE59581.1 DNA binding domain-containing protein, excisionase family [Ferrithrix thermotolerans DSM 19514]
MDLKDAANQLGVHYQTAYQWVREGKLRAEKIGASYNVDEEDLRQLIQQRSKPAPPPPKVKVRDWHQQKEKLLGHLLRGEELQARSQVQRLADGNVSVVEICEQLLSPALAEIGERWAEGSLTIAEEHRASAIVERSLANLMLSPAGRPKGVVVVATPPGDEHSLPATMATAALRNNRWITHHLGTQVPADDLVKISKDTGADLVVLTVTNPQALQAAKSLEKRLEEEGIPYLTGGMGSRLGDLLAAIEAKSWTNSSSNALSEEPHAQRRDERSAHGTENSLRN